jgi:hypothetical protein
MLRPSDRSGDDATSPSLDSVCFDTDGYEFRGEPTPGKLRVWYTPEGDGIFLYLFRSPPDIPAGANSVYELAAFYCRLVSDGGGKLVEVQVVGASGCRAVRTIVSFPQQPSGRAYLGSLTVPFRDFSFVLKCQCSEGQPTGLKAALLLDRSRAAGEAMRNAGDRFHVPNFDPDDPKHDEEFPHDPVARARRLLDRLARSLILAADVKRLTGFALPPGHT